jgi:imidazolonepropionase-like amidohydrolase
MNRKSYSSQWLLMPCLLWAFCLLISTSIFSQETYVLKPERVFDGNSMHPGWIVIVQGDKIAYAGEPAGANITTYDASTIVLEGATLMPGMIEGHSHLLLHPYNEESWNNQVLKESLAERVLRAGEHAKATLAAGFTTVRDLGSEGADYADVGIKTAIEKGIIVGPRMIVAGRAIVASGSYGPKGFAPHVDVPLGAEEADGVDLIRVVRTQIGHGADVVKVYADYRWGPNGEAMPTFTEDELKLIVETAKSSGRDVVAHASTAEGMRRATLAGVKTIEHGDGGTRAVFDLMKQKGVALCPTLAAGDAIMQYRGWKKGEDADPPRIVQKKASFKQALDAGVTICAGGDSGVFTHGDNARELEMMVEYGMLPLDVLRSVTSINAQVFNLDDQLGSIKAGMIADLIAVKGNPGANISNLRKIELVMKGGAILK